MRLAARARGLALTFCLLGGIGPAVSLPAAILETSESVYTLEETAAQRFRKLPDPEVVLPVPVLFDPAEGGDIACRLSALLAGEPVRSARARLEVEVLVLDLDAQTFEAVTVGRKKMRTDADGFASELFEFPSRRLAAADPAGLVVRGRFALAGGKKADQVSARCSLASEKRLAERAEAAPRSPRAAVAAESVSGTTTYLIDPARKLKRVPDPQQLAAVPRSAGDSLEVFCDAGAANRAGDPLPGARWTLLVELLVLDHAGRSFRASPIAVESQVTDAQGRAASAYQLTADGLGAGLESGAESAWVLAGLGLEGNKKAGQVSSTCLVTRR